MWDEKSAGTGGREARREGIHLQGLKLQLRTRHGDCRSNGRGEKRGNRFGPVVPNNAPERRKIGGGKAVTRCQAGQGGDLMMTRQRGAVGAARIIDWADNPHESSPPIMNVPPEKLARLDVLSSHSSALKSACSLGASRQ